MGHSGGSVGEVTRVSPVASPSAVCISGWRGGGGCRVWILTDEIDLVGDHMSGPFVFLSSTQVQEH